MWYRATEEALLVHGHRRTARRSTRDVPAPRADELGDAVKLTTLGKALCVAQYSAHTLKRTQPERAEKIYSDLLALMKPMQKLRLYLRRLLPKRGIR